MTHSNWNWWKSQCLLTFYDLSVYWLHLPPAGIVAISAQTITVYLKWCCKLVSVKWSIGMQLPVFLSFEPRPFSVHVVQKAFISYFSRGVPQIMSFHLLNLRPTSICIVLHIITQLVALYKSVMSVVTTHEKQCIFWECCESTPFIADRDRQNKELVKELVCLLGRTVHNSAEASV